MGLENVYGILFYWNSSFVSGGKAYVYKLLTCKHVLFHSLKCINSRYI
jgi:hypothetical protein